MDAYDNLCFNGGSQVEVILVPNGKMMGNSLFPHSNLHYNGNGNGNLNLNLIMGLKERMLKGKTSGSSGAF